MHTKRTKWFRWLEIIKQQLYDVMRSRFVFSETFRIINENPALPRQSLVYHFLQVWYADHAVMAVRRQIKSDPRAISLLRLLEDVQSNAQLVTPKGYGDDAVARQSWRRIAGAGAQTLSTAIVTADIDLLRKTVAEVERFADKRIAHHDRAANADSPTYDQLNASLDRLDQLFRKYYGLITGKALLSTTPSIGYNWMKAFEYPWRIR